LSASAAQLGEWDRVCAITATSGGYPILRVLNIRSEMWWLPLEDARQTWRQRTRAAKRRAV
jgi:hypothetical protein